MIITIGFAVIAYLAFGCAFSRYAAAKSERASKLGDAYWVFFPVIWLPVTLWVLGEVYVAHARGRA